MQSVLLYLRSQIQHNLVLWPARNCNLKEVCYLVKAMKDLTKRRSVMMLFCTLFSGPLSSLLHSSNWCQKREREEKSHTSMLLSCEKEANSRGRQRSKEYKKGQRDTFQDILGLLLASSKGKKSWATTSWNNGLFKRIILPTFITSGFTRHHLEEIRKLQPNTQMQFVFYTRAYLSTFQSSFLSFQSFFCLSHLQKYLGVNTTFLWKHADMTRVEGDLGTGSIKKY